MKAGKIESSGECPTGDCGFGTQKRSLPRVPKKFGEHLKLIKAAKAAADSIASQAKPEPMNAAEASVAILWEMIFDYLCNAKDFTAGELGSISGVVQKLASVARSGLGVAERRQSGGTSISLEALEKIEEKLRLL